jgi:ABC-2 type transport system ATP-binding protein
MTTSLPSSDSGAPGGVQLRAVARSYGADPAVRHVDLDIAPGETVALLGPNGAGKSTTIDMILGLTRPDHGTVSVFGQSPERAVASGAVGGMLQVGALLRDLGVRELVTVVASLYPNPLDVDEVIDLAGLTAVAGHRTQKLSGGETQRVRFALAVVANPDLLVLDEPTAALDVEGRNAFWKHMRAFAANGRRTVLFATHHLDEADRFADRVVLMARGRIVADGPANEIKGLVGTRTIRATLDAGVDELAALPGVATAERRGEAALLTCRDSDAALRALLGRYPTASAIEVTGAGLEEAFLDLTADANLEAAR